MAAHGKLQWIGWGQAEERVRVLWRILAGLLIFFGSQIVAFVLASSLFGIDLESPEAIVIVAVSTILFLGLFGLYARYLDGTRIRDYGIREPSRFAKHFAAGFLAPVIATGVVFTVSLAIGEAEIVATTDLDVLGVAGWSAYMFFLILGGSIMEGIFYGAILCLVIFEGARRLGGDSRLSLTLAVGLTAALFSGLHFVYGDPGAAPGVPWYSLAIYWMLAGFVMVYGYVLTGSLAWPIAVNATPMDGRGLPWPRSSFW